MAIDWNLILQLANAGGQVASGLSAGRAAGRAAENTAVQDRYQTEQQAKLGAAALTEGATKDRADRFLTASKTRAQQVGLGELLQNLRSTSVSGLPSYIPKVQFSGGLTPDALGPMTRQAGSNLAQQALAAQLSGADVPNLPDVSQLGADAPALRGGNAFDTFLNTVGGVGAGAGVYTNYRAGQQQQAQDAADRAQRQKVLDAILQSQQQGTPAPLRNTAGSGSPIAQLLAMKQQGIV